MATRNIRIEGEPILRKKSKEVKEINDKIITLLNDMRETMHEADGVGLAAVQVGSLKRIFIAEIGDEEDEDRVIEFINPKIISVNGSQVNIEGCLSLPGKTGYVERPIEIKIKALDRNGVEHIYEYEDYYATVICHEYDHLDGILYNDKLVDPPENEDIDDIVIEE